MKRRVIVRVSSAEICAIRLLFEVGASLWYCVYMDIKGMLAGIGHGIAVVTDWLLIIAGGLLVFKALVAIDVPAARYTVLGVGFLFLGAGIWYRYRRKQRHR